MTFFSQFTCNNRRFASVASRTFPGFLCLLLLASSLPVLAADEMQLSPGQGYLLLRVNVNQNQRIGRFSFANVDTDDGIKIRTKSFRSAGASAWMTLVVAPEGRYYWSEYESGYGNSVEESRDLDQVYRRSGPKSADDTFEIVAGAVNYIGDWTMRVASSERRRLNPLVQFEKTTLERYVTEYPEFVNDHPIYLSMMGKAAISLDELAKIVESQQE